MAERLNTKRFFSSIFTIIAFICLVFSILQWYSFNDIESKQQELTQQQHNVMLVKEIRNHAIQLQQYLTNVAATHRQQGFQAAASHLHASQFELRELCTDLPNLAVRCDAIEREIISTYEIGVKMDWDYINQGMEAGNLLMIEFDSKNAALTAELSDLAQILSADLMNDMTDNSITLYLNRLILILSTPMILGILGVFIAKTSRIIKSKMNDLRDRTAQLNTILDTAASAIITIDKHAEILSFNQAAELIFGYQQSEALGMTINSLIPAFMSDKQDNYLQHYLKTGDKSQLATSLEFEALRKNGEHFPITLRVNPMKIHGQVFFSGVIDDISETKTLQSQLNQAQKLEAIGQLASGIAHEINTPIQYIGDNLMSVYENFNDIIAFREDLDQLGDADFKQALQALDKRFDLPYILEDSPKAIKQAKEGVERVAEIVKAMKTFSHIDSGLTLMNINLHEALNSTLTITRNSYKNIADVETDFANNVDFIECYASELNQVFLNLIINATHAIEEKQQGRGLIKVSTRKLDENTVEIQIADNGAGIPEAIKEKVFNLFFTTKPVGKGTGQGLSLAHSIIVEKHRGKLFFESTVGKGTTFHLQLPLLQDNKVKVAETQRVDNFLLDNLTPTLMETT
ncbi:PAS domain S-box protein [Methylomonas sp. AM2-LC]|uniref:two-component system sensor histidine kinase NtrB n=1 Tax=Methylomonas sp. AM2-LC TaxID=3153301 RepID=UPI003262E8EA